jgi:phage shock protein PspC (stress-responsive transcriptional regulator)
MRRYAFEEGRTPLIEFHRDSERGWLLGVCAGLAARLGWDLTVVRLVALLCLLVATVPTGLLYLVVGCLTPAKPLTYYGSREDRLWRRRRRGYRGDSA